MWSALFPGQGSQHVGMGQFLYDNFKVAQELFEEASDCLLLDFKKLCFTGPESDLALTYNTQPALLLVSVASYRVLNEVSELKFTTSAGHSVGEYAAIVAAGGLKFTDALKAVRHRGEWMQEAVPLGMGGMMAVMGLSENQVNTLCRWAEKESGEIPVEPANYNSPEQIVISGNQKALEYIKNNAQKEQFDPSPKKLRLVPLKVSAPFHCSMMRPAEEKMREFLSSIEFKAPQFSIVQNVDAEPVEDPAKLRENLILQISSPVRWVEGQKKIQELGVTRAVELGSGQVLKGLAKKILPEGFEVFSMRSMEDVKALEALK